MGKTIPRAVLYLNRECSCIAHGCKDTSVGLVKTNLVQLADSFAFFLSQYYNFSTKPVEQVKINVTLKAWLRKTRPCTTAISSTRSSSKLGSVSFIYCMSFILLSFSVFILRYHSMKIRVFFYRCRCILVFTFLNVRFL